jgi:hypothetical protein
MYLFKLLISASLKRHFHVLSYAGKDKKINQGSGSTVAGFVFILVLMFALQYLIKLGNEVGLAYQSPLYFTKAISWEKRRLIVTARRNRLFSYVNAYCF